MLSRHLNQMEIEDFILHIEEGDLYVTIPLEIAKEAGILEGCSLSLSVEEGKITLTKNNS